jgi:hypothetical protein
MAQSRWTQVVKSSRLSPPLADDVCCLIFFAEASKNTEAILNHKQS